MSNIRRFAKILAFASAVVANQVSGQYLAHQDDDVEQPPTEDLVVGEFYYL